MVMKSAQLTKFLKSIMVFTGSWRLKISANKFKQTSYDIYSVVFQLSLVCFCLGLVCNLPVLLRNKDFQLIAENVGYTIITLVMLTKLIICQTWKVQRLLIQCIMEEKQIFQEKSEKIQENLGLHVKHLNHIFNILLPLTTVLLTTFIIANGIDYVEYRNFNSTVNKPLPLPIWYPFDSNSCYTAAFVIGIWLTLVGTLYNIVTQVLFLTLMTYVSLQLKALKIYCKYFHLYCECLDFNSGTENMEEAVLKYFRNICIKHQDIIRFVDEINMAMRNILFLEYFLNSINIASVTIRILMMSNPPAMLTFCVILLAHQILQLFWMSWHANEIELQSVSLSDALFQSKWYDQSENVKQVICIMMMRSKKPLRIFIGPFYPMSIRTALASMKAAYSLVTLIFTLADDN
nr:odorant receptor 25 [Pachyrhinus yasumatsui]